MDQVFVGLLAVIAAGVVLLHILHDIDIDRVLEGRTGFLSSANAVAPRAFASASPLRNSVAHPGERASKCARIVKGTGKDDGTLNAGNNLLGERPG